MGHACVCACAHVGAPASPFAPASQPTSIPEHPDDTKLSLAEKTQMKRSPRQGGGAVRPPALLSPLWAPIIDHSPPPSSSSTGMEHPKSPEFCPCPSSLAVCPFTDDVTHHGRDPLSLGPAQVPL